MATLPLRVKSVTPSRALKHCLDITAGTDDCQSTVNYLVQAQPFEHMRGQLLSLTVGEVDDETGAIMILPKFEHVLNRDSLTYSKVGGFTYGRVGAPPSIEHKPGLNIVHHDAWFSSIYYNDQPIALDISRAQALGLMEHLGKLEEVIQGQSDLKLVEVLLTKSGIRYEKTTPPTGPAEVYLAIPHGAPMGKRRFQVDLSFNAKNQLTNVSSSVTQK